MLLSRIDRVLSGGAAKGGRGADPASPEGGQAARAEAAGVIGERFETIQDSLDQLGELTQQFGRFESLLTQLRQPLEAEFKARRDNHVEVINLRAANAELSAAIAENRGDTAEVRAAVHHFHSAMGDLQMATIRHVFDMRSVLTPTQAEAFDRAVVEALRADAD